MNQVKPTKKAKPIQRYSAPERINHWIVAFCFIFAAISGLGFFFPSFNWLNASKKTALSTQYADHGEVCIPHAVEVEGRREW